MAKLFVLLFAVVCVVLIFSQTASAARIARDTDGNELLKGLENALDSFRRAAEETFTQENLNKLKDQLSEFGEKVKAAGNNLVKKDE